MVKPEATVHQDNLYYLTNLSVSDYHALPQITKAQLQEFLKVTNRPLVNWEELSAKDEKWLSVGFNELSAFDFDVQKAAATLETALGYANEKAFQFFQERIRPYKQANPYDPQAPNGMPWAEYAQIIKKRAMEIYDTEMHYHYYRHIEEYFDRIRFY